MKTITVILPLMLISLFVTTFEMTAQTPDSIITDDTTKLPVEKTKIHTVLAGAGYGSNMIYMGSSISQNKPFGYAALTYGLFNKLFLGVTSVHVADMSPFAAFNAFTANFNQIINSWLDISAGLSRYQVAKSLTDTLFSNFSYGEVNLGIDWKLLYTQFNACGVLSGENGIYYQLKNSRYFETPEFTRKKFYFSFDPYFNFLFGTLTKSETINGTVVVNQYPPFRKQGNTGSGSLPVTTYTKTFSLIEIDAGIPIAFNASRFTVEIEPGYIYSTIKDSGYTSPEGFLFLFSLYFRII